MIQTARRRPITDGRHFGWQVREGRHYFRTLFCTNRPGNPTGYNRGMNASSPQSLRRDPLAWLIPCLIFCLAAAPAAETIKLDGAVPSRKQWTLAQLNESFAAEIHVVEFNDRHGAGHAAHCLSLLTLLKSAGVVTQQAKPDPAADPKQKNRFLRLAVVVEGRDGYAATFSLAELLPDNGDRKAWLALDQDNLPLPEREGPVKLIVPADGKPGRWVHSVEKITVFDPTAAATRPASQ